uniref:Uncharacterized protein n=1 Tax=Ditylenchus dipsaci TaxID=166011 RepID=A0A915CN86_9BILA
MNVARLKYRLFKRYQALKEEKWILCSFERSCNGRCSAVQTAERPGRKAYRYDVDIALLTTTSDGSPYEKNLAKGSDEGLRARNRNLCYEILAAAYGKTAGFGIEEKAISSTTASPRFTLRCLLTCQTRTFCSPTMTGHCLELSDLEQYTTKRSLQHEDRSVRTFLEMALAQTPLNEDEYTRIGAGKLFEVPKQEMRSVGNGMNYGKPCPAVIIDAKISPFFVAQDLYKTIFDMCNRREPQGTETGRILDICLWEFGLQLRKPSSRIIISKFLFADYCSQVLGVTLRYPHWRVVVADSKAGEFYPAELCYVMLTSVCLWRRWGTRCQTICSSGSNEVQIGVRHILVSLLQASKRSTSILERWMERASAGMRFYKTYDVSNWIVLYGCTPSRAYLYARSNLAAFDGGTGMQSSRSALRSKSSTLCLSTRLEDTHGMLKYYEAKYKVLTQHVTYEKAFDIIRDRRKMQTLENILNKTTASSSASTTSSVRTLSF